MAELRRRVIMKRKVLRNAASIVTVLALMTSAVGCGSQSQVSASDSGAQKIRIGVNVSVSGKNSYLDEDDNLT